MSTAATPTPSGTSGGRAAGDVTQIRTFNRYELKYLADPALVTAIRAAVTPRLDIDAHSGGAAYPLWSLYYDTADLRCYWEKIDGLKFRRKLRVRCYGEAGAVAPDTPVWVEIKQRLNRVTQKRRALLRYDDARAVCAGEVADGGAPEDAAVMDEARRFVTELSLVPSSVVGYQREAFVGRDEDAGLRLTIDHRVRGRITDLDLAVAGANHNIVRPDLAVVEIKVNERVPYWLTETVARLGLQIVRISKYCQSIDTCRVARDVPIHSLTKGSH